MDQSVFSEIYPFYVEFPERHFVWINSQRTCGEGQSRQSRQRANSIKICTYLKITYPRRKITLGFRIGVTFPDYNVIPGL